MDFILGRRLKFYTKETFKFLNFTLLALAIIFAMILIKFKPVYEVKISGREIGFIQNKNSFQSTVKANIQNYQAKNVYEVNSQEPEYQLKLVNREQEISESDILIALQKDMTITYQYFDIYIEQEKVQSVDTLADAKDIMNSLKEKNSNLNIEIKEILTQDVDQVDTEPLEVAKSNVFKKYNIMVDEQKKQEEEKKTINGVKLAVVPVQGTITSRYGASSRIRVSTHTGLDIGAVKGTPIKAVASGTVTFAAYNGSYGNMVKIDHGNGVETWYAHTSKMYVKVGQKVDVGSEIAAVGSTGNSTGPHLHLEIRVNGEHINPQNYLY